MPQHIKVVGAPGYPEEFRAVLIPGLHEVPQPGEAPVSVISTEAGELLAVPSDTVRFVEGPRVMFEGWPEGAQRVEGTVTGRDEDGNLIVTVEKSS